MTTPELSSVRDRATELGYPLARGDVTRVELLGSDVPLSALRWRTTNPDLVLLHGGGQNAHTWDSMLIRSGRPALCIDLPGHGHSGWYDDPAYLPARLGTTLLTALRARGGATVTLVGMSLGALAALNCAARAPELVRRLVIVDSSPGLTPSRSQSITTLMDHQAFENEEELVRLVAEHTSGSHLAGLRRSLRYGTRRLPDGRLAWRHDQRRRRDGSDQMSRLFEALPHSWDDVAALEVPTLLVVAQHSEIVSWQDVEEYHRLCPSLVSVSVPGAGHSIQTTRPDALSALLGPDSAPVGPGTPLAVTPR